MRRAGSRFRGRVRARGRARARGRVRVRVNQQKVTKQDRVEVRRAGS